MGNAKSNLNQGFAVKQEVLDADKRLEGKLSKGGRVCVVGHDQEAVVTGFSRVYVWAAIDGKIWRFLKSNVYLPGEEPPSKPVASDAPAPVSASASSGSLGMPGSIQAQPQRQVTPASDPAIQKVFKRYDKDGSGQMEAKELRSCLRQLNVLVDDVEGDEVRRPARL